ncbi:hypothetical protein PVAP13_J696100 [Panicum virgatum]|nr:hypothetical protein PVAP13_J696100 [Panicum virgatum]
MSVTAIFTKGGNNRYEMQDHRMIIQINIDSEESSVHSDKDISISALE